MSLPADAFPTPTPISSQPEQSLIADLSYRNYDGPLQTRALRWWIVAVSTLRANTKRNRVGYWLPGILIALVYGINGLIFYFSHLIRNRIPKAPPTIFDAPDPNYYTLSMYQVMGFTGLLIFIAALTVGSSSIAADNRANALLVYLSKPLTRIDYLFGKWMGIFLLLFAILFIPAFLYYLFFVVSYYSEGFLRENPYLILSLTAVSLLTAAIHTSLILGISAWSKSTRLAGGIYAAVYFLIAIIAGIAGGLMISRDKDSKHAATDALVGNLSVDGVPRAVAMNLYDIAPSQVPPALRGGRRLGRKSKNSEGDDSDTLPYIPERAPLVPLLLISGLLILVPVGAAAARIRAVEIVKG